MKRVTSKEEEVYPFLETFKKVIKRSHGCFCFRSKECQKWLKLIFQFKEASQEDCNWSFTQECLKNSHEGVYGEV